MEKLRDIYVQAATPEAKKKAAEDVQRRFVEIVTHVHLGEWFGVSAVRSNIGTMAVPPPVTVFWGVTKK
jgi:peptide/nickel transport system substrate-binding protein